MAVLIFLMLLAAPAYAVSLPEQNVAIIFDPGNPNASVGIVGHEMLETGSLQEEYEVIGFEKNAIIVKEQDTGDMIKWLPQGKVDRKILSRARQWFIVKQMRAIYEAQMRYVEKAEDHYAPHLKHLIDHGFLADGYEKSKKQGYKFRVAETGLTPKTAAVKREPTFFAVAEPLDPEKDPYYFSVDHLGQVRFAPALNILSWAPVWDYADRSGGPRVTRVVYASES
jgi:hypothetical protein